MKNHLHNPPLSSILEARLDYEMQFHITDERSFYMGCLKILKKDDAIVNVHSNIGIFSLKAKDDNLEVVLIEAHAGKSLFLHPYECENAMYLFYLLSGVLNYAKDHVILTAGDCISAKDLSETEYFEIVEDVKMLMVTQKTFLTIKRIML